MSWRKVSRSAEFRIAAKYRVPKAAIIEANRLVPPYKIKTGQSLLVPGPKEATAPVVVASRASEAIPLDDPAPNAASAPAPSVPSSAQPQPEAGPSAPALSVLAVPVPPSTSVTDAPVQPLAVAAAPAGVTCPPGRTGTWSTDIIKQPLYICR